MFTLFPLALLLLPSIVTASPQYMFAGDTSCDEMKTTYTTTSTADVTTSVGDQGWQNYDGNICTAGTARKLHHPGVKRSAPLTPTQQPAAIQKENPTPNPSA